MTVSLVVLHCSSETVKADFINKSIKLGFSFDFSRFSYVKDSSGAHLILVFDDFTSKSMIDEFKLKLICFRTEMFVFSLIHFGFLAIANNFKVFLHEEISSRVTDNLEQTVDLVFLTIEG